jgi:hypothetical protein
MNKRCIICNNEYQATRKWSKYCSDKCRKKAKSLAVIKSRRKNKPLMISSLKELKTKEPYKTNYEKIMKALEYKKIIKAPYENIFKDDIEKKEKYLKRHKKRYEKISWDYLIKETGFSSDTLGRYIRIMRKLGIISSDSYDLIDSYKFEPLKIFYKDIILDCPNYCIWSLYNSTLFHPYITSNEFTNEKIWCDNDVINFKELIEKFGSHYAEMLKFFDKIGLKKSALIWEKFVKNNQLSKYVKIFLYFKLIQFHYLSSFRPWFYVKRKKYYIKGRKEDFDDIYYELFTQLERESFNDFVNADVINWKNDFSYLIDQVYYNFIKRIFNSFDEENFSKKIDKILSYFREMQILTLNKRIEMGYFIATLHPAFLTSKEMNRFYGVKNEKSKEIKDSLLHENASFSKRKKSLINKFSKSLTNNNEINKASNQENNKILSFIEKFDIFGSFNKKIKKLGYFDKHELYSELNQISIVFQKPIEDIFK